MENSRKRKIYSDNNLTVESIETPEVDTKPMRNAAMRVNLDDGFVASSTASTSKKIAVADVFDAFAGYLPPRINFMGDEPGQCAICGKATVSDMRKICFDCLQENGKNIYEKAKKAIKYGNKEITIE